MIGLANYDERMKKDAIGCVPEWRARAVEATGPQGGPRRHGDDLGFGGRDRPCTICGTLLAWLGDRKSVPAIFYRPEAGGEPVRDWLKSLPSPDDRKRIGYDIEAVEFGWPSGMPVCRYLEDGICEVRTGLGQNRIARVLFYIDSLGRMVLLHGFIKKTQRTTPSDLKLARANKHKHERGLQ